MKEKVDKPTADVGVVVGRFQVSELHEAHKDLIQTVVDKHDKVIVCLGVSDVPTTRENPLDFESRKQMIQESFPGVIITFIKDQPSNILWSSNLDITVSSLCTPGQSIVLYGSRDSFINAYVGKLNTIELEPEIYTNISGTEVRKSLSIKTSNSKDFRHGVIWATNNQFTKVYPTVDIAIFNEHYTKILLAKKPTDTMWRFVGGFADTGSSSYEEDAKREVMEETHLEVGDMVYLGSKTINDWRYRGKDKIRTMLFSAKVIFGSPVPDDDISELKWFDLGELRENADNIILPGHLQLFNDFIKQNRLFPKF